MKPASTIKICGLSTAPTLEAALDAGADVVGFVFFEKSPRHLSLDQARALAEQARGRAEIAVLTVDAPDAALAAIVAAVAPDILQLHGRETPARLADLKRTFRIARRSRRSASAALTISRPPAPMPRSPIACCSTPRRLAMLAIQAATASPSTGACSPGSIWRRHGSCRAGLIRIMSPRRSPSPARAASTFPPASKVRLGSKTSARSRRLSLRRAALSCASAVRPASARIDETQPGRVA